MRQVDILWHAEADAWFERNRSRLGVHDPVTKLIDEMEVKPETMLEVGCANGWRLAKWRMKYGTRCMGVEPSHEAVVSGNREGNSIRRGTADRLPLLSNWAQVIIYGFCLYLTDPEDWFRIAAEGDRVLAPGGYLIIHDFHATGLLDMQPYKHDERLVSYHFDFALLWHAHPRYSLLRRVIDGENMISVLRKNELTGISS